LLLRPPPQAQLLIKGLLRKDPQWRLGSELPMAAASSTPGRLIREHGFFHVSGRLNWEHMDKKQIRPPWVPSLDGTGTDMRYVDLTFAEADPTDTPSKMKRQDAEREHFDNFTYVLQSPLLRN
jgi:hypothetical protein